MKEELDNLKDSLKETAGELSGEISGLSEELKSGAEAAVGETEEELPEVPADETVYDGVKAETEKEKAEKKPPMYAVYEWLDTFALALALMVFLLLFVFKYVTVDGTSMTNTLQDEQVIIISELNEYEPGDIVVLCHPQFKKPLVKRLIATGGQTISFDFDNWTVYVDGEELDEPYIKRAVGTAMRSYNFGELATGTGTYTVPRGYVFVMGDNRNGSTDSRTFGAVDERLIIGEAVISLYPNPGLLN